MMSTRPHDMTTMGAGTTSMRREVMMNMVVGMTSMADIIKTEYPVPGILYPTGIGFPVFPASSSDIFYFFLRSLIPDKLPEEEK
jgi:hypothetical protein